MTRFRLISCALFAIPLACAALSAAAQQPPDARIIKLKGEVSVESGRSRSPASPGAVLREGDRLATGRNSLVQWRMSDDSTLSLGEHSAIRLGALAAGPDGRNRYLLEKGSVRGLGGSRAALLESPLGRADIRLDDGKGATFDCHLGSALYCGAYEGSLAVANSRGALTLGLGSAHDFAVLVPNAPPKGLLYRPDALSDLSRYPPDTYIGQQSDEDSQSRGASLGRGSPGNGGAFPSPAPIKIEPRKQPEPEGPVGAVPDRE